MLSDTLAEGLERYEIGPKIRALRVKKGLSLVQFGEHCGLSSAMLSKIERSQIFPTLPTLLRIAMVFGVGLEHFFIDNKERPLMSVTRKNDRLPLPDRLDGAASYMFESLNFPVTNKKFDAYYAEFSAHADASEPHSHPGAELVFVTKGQLAVAVDGEDVILNEGDALYFECAAPHSYRRSGRTPCAAIVVVAP